MGRSCVRSFTVDPPRTRSHYSCEGRIASNGPYGGSAGRGLVPSAVVVPTAFPGQSTPLSSARRSNRSRVRVLLAMGMAIINRVAATRSEQ